MLKIKSNLKVSQFDWLDEARDVDWDGDNNDTSPRKGIVNDDNLQNYLSDDVDVDNTLLDTTQPESPDNSNLEPVNFLEEIPRGNENLGIPENSKEIEYSSPRRLVYDGIENMEVISFEYTNRFGAYAGLRTVEPHYTFVAKTTGNEILVTFDRDINDIRAFIVGNIHPNGVRYDSVNFEPRPEIMVGVI